MAIHLRPVGVIKMDGLGYPANRSHALAYLLATILCLALALVIVLMSPPFDPRLLLVALSFPILGGLIKFGDQSYDSERFSKRASLALALPGGLLMGSLILWDKSSATIFIGMLMALLITAKYDNLAFQLGFAVTSIFALVSFINFPNNVDLVGAGMIFLSAFADEVASDNADRSRSGSSLGRLMKERPFMKVAVLVLCAVGIINSFAYLFAFLAFDLAYSFVERIPAE
ncbi:MAG TPA: hypothetical protein VGK23_04385 [Methanomassiliicoccales archaeon]